MKHLPVLRFPAGKNGIGEAHPVLSQHRSEGLCPLKVHLALGIEEQIVRLQVDHPADDQDELFASDLFQESALCPGEAAFYARRADLCRRPRLQARRHGA